MQRQHPELLKRMVFSSGAPTSARTQTFLMHPDIICLDKPISSVALKQFIAQHQATMAASAQPRGRTDERA